jgi:hypothetical protein
MARLQLPFLGCLVFRIVSYSLQLLNYKASTDEFGFREILSLPFCSAFNFFNTNVTKQQNNKQGSFAVFSPQVTCTYRATAVAGEVGADSCW